MAEYPENIYEQRTLENLPGIVFDALQPRNLFAEDILNLANEIIAIETVLGLEPNGAYETVKAWLEALSEGGGATWGDITGTLSDQTDLQNALDDKEDALGFTPENVANKSLDVETDQASDTKYPSVKAVYDFVTENAPSVSFIGANVYNSSNQSIPDSTETVLNFDSENFDTGGFHSNTTNNSRLTISETGYYLVGFAFRWAGNATPVRQVRVKKNASDVILINEKLDAYNNTFSQEGSTLVYLEAGDYLQIHVRQFSGSSLNTSSNAPYSPQFWIKKES